MTCDKCFDDVCDVETCDCWCHDDEFGDDDDEYQDEDNPII